MNFPSPPIQVCEAINALRTNKDWQTFQSWLRDIALSQDIVLREGEGNVLTRGQGAVQVMSFVLIEIEKSPETYTKLKTKAIAQLMKDKETLQLRKHAESQGRPR